MGKKGKSKSKLQNNKCTEKKGARFPSTAFFECQECKNLWCDFDLGFNKNKIMQDCLECGNWEHPLLTEDRCFGNYKCKKCKKIWFSAYSYAKTWQQCKDCKREVFPHTMRPLKKRCKDNKKDKNHMKNLCGRCRELGYSCQNSSSDDTDFISKMSNLKI